jgi:hypothetical protein
MVTQFYRSEKIADNKIVYQFKSLVDYELFIEDVFKRIKSKMARSLANEYNSDQYYKSSSRDKDWFGTTDAELARKTDTFLFSDKLSNELEGFRRETIRKDAYAIDNKKKLVFTEKEIGLFSFDLASLGLVRVYEYWSPLLHELVNPNAVKSAKNEKGQLYFYHVEQKGVKRHEVKYEPSKVGFFSRVLNMIVPSELLEKEEGVEIIEGKQVEVINYFYPEKKDIPEHVVEQRQKVKNGQPEFKTTFKKSFIHIDQLQEMVQKVELVLSASYSASRSAENEIFWAAVAGIAIAEKLSDAGIRFRISVAFPASANKKNVYSFVTLKDENEPLNKNKIATAVSDARFFRGIGFKGFISIFEESDWGDFLMTGIAKPITSPDDIKDAYMKFLSLQTNSIDKQDALNPETKIVFAGALSKQDAIRQYNEVLQKIQKLKTA